MISHRTEVHATMVRSVSPSKNKKPRTTPTPEFDKAWVVAYVADRRARGVNPSGALMDQETPDSDTTVLSNTRNFCSHGHAMTPENTYTNPTNGQTACKVCRKIVSRQSYERAKAVEKTVGRGAKPLVTHCVHGHEFTPENTMPNGFGKCGTPRRKCRTCHNKNNGVKRPRVAHTHCPHGHEYTPENTYTNPTNGHKSCRTCARKHDRSMYEKRVQATWKDA